MPFSGVVLTANNASGVASANTAAIDLPANQLIVAYTIVFHSVPGDVAELNLSSPNATWVKIASIDFFNPATTGFKFAVYRTMVASDVAGEVVAITGNGIAQTIFGWGFTRWPNVVTTGANGAGAVVALTPSTSNGAVADTTWTITGPAFAAARNRPIGIISSSGGFDMIAGTGLTELLDHWTLTGGGFGCITEYVDSPDNVVEATRTTGGSHAWAGVLIEVAFLPPFFDGDDVETFAPQSTESGIQSPMPPELSIQIDEPAGTGGTRPRRLSRYGYN